MINVDAAEVGRFEALSHRFWDAHGEFRPLHILNPARTQFILGRLPIPSPASRGRVREGTSSPALKVLDVGCGGGLLCESLTLSGAQVTGIDLAPGMIEVARLHASEQKLNIDYRLADASDLAREHPGEFDVVSSMEMLEHVPDPAAMMATLARLVRPGGSVFVSTVNRNLKSFLMTIVGAEYLLRLIPRGTHEYEKLIRPAELAQWGRAAGLRLREVAGLNFDPFTERCQLSRDPSVNYLMHLERTGTAQ